MNQATTTSVQICTLALIGIFSQTESPAYSHQDQKEVCINDMPQRTRRASSSAVLLARSPDFLGAAMDTRIKVMMKRRPA